MSNFCIKNYEVIVPEIINDAFYANNSNSGKIASIRRYTEVIVRKILNWKDGEKFTLGNKRTQKEIGSKSIFLFRAVDTIRNYGNDASHTEFLQSFCDEDMKRVLDALFNLLAYMFIDYFEKYPVGIDTNQEVLDTFSLLPPVIRYKTFSYLFHSNPENIYIADRLVLSIIKTFDKEAAEQWLEGHRTILLPIKYPSRELKRSIVEEYGEEFAKIRFDDLPYKNAYELCRFKAEQVGEHIEHHGKLYETFEEAKSYYRQWRPNDATPELAELLSIMDFVYLGRA